MLRELVGLGQDRLLPVAVRLVMDNVRGSVMPAALLVAVLYWVVHNSSNTAPMLWWAVLTVGSKLVCWQHARHHLGRDLTPEAAHRLVWQLVLLMPSMESPGAHWSGSRWTPAASPAAPWCWL